MSGVINCGSPFAIGRDRTSGAYPGGSDRSSGTDPVLTRHSARRETRRDFRPSGRPAGDRRVAIDPITCRAGCRLTPRPKPSTRGSRSFAADTSRSGGSSRRRFSAASVGDRAQSRKTGSNRTTAFRAARLVGKQPVAAIRTLVPAAPEPTARQRKRRRDPEEHGDRRQQRNG